MADVHGFRSVSTARRLERMSQYRPGETGKTFIPGIGVDSIAGLYPAMTIHIGVLSSEVTAATFTPADPEADPPIPANFHTAGSGTALLYRRKTDDDSLILPEDYRDTSAPPQAVTVHNFMRTTFPADASPGSISATTKYYYILEDSTGTYWLLPQQPVIMLCTASAASAPGVPTVTCTVSNQLYGEPPLVQPFSVNKIFSDQTLVAGDKLIVFGDKDNPAAFYGFTPGAGGSGVAFYLFSLLEDKGDSDNAALALIYAYIPGTGWELVVDESEDPIQVYVLDPFEPDHRDKWTGYGPYTDPLYGPQPGYGGLCYFLVDDWNTTGKPGYEIVTMEHRCRYIEARMPTALENPGGLTNMAIIENYWDGRSPKTTSAASSSEIVTGVPFVDTQSLFGTRAPNSKMKLVWDHVREIDVLFAVKAESGVSHTVQGYLNTDLTIAMATVQITVTRSSDPAVVASSVLTVNNPINELFGGGTNRLFIGNADCFVVASKFGEDYWLDVVQPPILKPVAPP